MSTPKYTNLLGKFDRVSSTFWDFEPVPFPKRSDLIPTDQWNATWRKKLEFCSLLIFRRILNSHQEKNTLVWILLIEKWSNSSSLHFLLFSMDFVFSTISEIEKIMFCVYPMFTRTFCPKFHEILPKKHKLLNRKHLPIWGGVPFVLPDNPGAKNAETNRF